MQPIIYSENPIIHKFSQVLTVDQAGHFINLARPKMKAAAVADYQGESISDNRTNQVCWLEKNQDDMVFSVCQKISELVDRPLSHSERIQVIYYKKGEEFKPHFDAIRPVSVYTQESLTRMGGSVS